MGKSSIKVLLCNKNNIFRNSFGSLINDYYDNISVIHSVEKFKDLIPILDNEKIDYLIIKLDKYLEKPSEFIPWFLQKYPNTKLIIMSFSNDISYKNKLLELGIYYYYETGTNIEDLINSIKSNTKINS